MLERQLRKAAFALGVQLLVTAVKRAAEGKYGTRWKAIYWSLAGLKRRIAILLGVAAAVCAALGDLRAGMYVGAAGGLLYSVGLLDAGWRDVRPSSDLTDNPTYRFFADNAATMTMVLATAAAFVDAGHCVGDCDLLMRIIVGTGAGLAYLGCADAAWRASPPLFLPFPYAAHA